MLCHNFLAKSLKGKPNAVFKGKHLFKSIKVFPVLVGPKIFQFDSFYKNKLPQIKC